MSILKKAADLINQKLFRMESEKVRAYEEFLREELKPFDEIMELDLKDLAEIHSRAAQIATSTSYGEEVNGKRVFSDPNLLQAYCYVMAVYGKFKSRNVIIHDIQIGDLKDIRRKNQV